MKRVSPQFKSFRMRVTDEEMASLQMAQRLLGLGLSSYVSLLFTAASQIWQLVQYDPAYKRAEERLIRQVAEAQAFRNKRKEKIKKHIVSLRLSEKDLAFIDLNMSYLGLTKRHVYILLLHHMAVALAPRLTCDPSFLRNVVAAMKAGSAACLQHNAPDSNA